VTYFNRTPHFDVYKKARESYSLAIFFLDEFDQPKDMALQAGTSKYSLNRDMSTQDGEFTVDDTNLNLSVFEIVLPDTLAARIYYANFKTEDISAFTWFDFTVTVHDHALSYPRICIHSGSQDVRILRGKTGIIINPGWFDEFR